MIYSIIGYTVLGMVAAICIFMVVHTILEIRKLNRETVFIDIIKDGEKVGVITLNKPKTRYCCGDAPIRYSEKADEKIVVMTEKRITKSPGNIELEQERSLIWQ